MNLGSVTCNGAMTRKIRGVVVIYLRIHSGKQLYPVFSLPGKEAVIVF